MPPYRKNMHWASRFPLELPMIAIAATSFLYAVQATAGSKVEKIRPTVEMISPDENGKYFFYSGHWFQRKRPAVSIYRNSKNGLVIPFGGVIATASPSSKPGRITPLDARRDFSVEFEVALSSNSTDHWPAVWLMPIEHDAKQNDRALGHPQGVEHWVEIDVDEGGFGPGTHGVTIEWFGRWPNYTREVQGAGTSSHILDRTKFHRFRITYKASTKMVRWWLDGRPGSAYTLPWIGPHNYYLIVNAASHGQNEPYLMTLRSIVINRGL